MSFVDRINKGSDNVNIRRAWLGIAVAVFVCIILVPSMFVITKIATEWDTVSEVISDSRGMSQILVAVWNSFSIAALVTIVDIIAGMPIAWIMVRKVFKGKKVLDTLLDLPLAFPTAVLGLSVLIFWGAPEGVVIPGLGLGIGPYAMLILLHFIFTYPYMVRSLSAIFEQIDVSYETAAMTLGASRLTAFRTITLPLFRAGLVTGFILCFSRSLSETGGTLIALTLMKVDTTFFTGPTYISAHGGEGPMILISVIMIVFALFSLVVMNPIIARFRIGGETVWPEFGRKLSRGLVPRAKDALAIMFMVVAVLVPSFYIFTYLAEPASIDGGALLSSIGMSFLVAGTAVVFDIIFGTPVAIYIARHKNERRAEIFDTLINIPLLMPTTALGFSLTLFWGAACGSGPMAVVLVILGHISFTYPLVVRNIIGAVEGVDPSYEESAMTLGAKPFQAFYKVLMPIIKPSIIAGAILVFTRSLGETGATIAIAPGVRTAPCYIVDLVKAGSVHYAEAAMCSIILIAICFVLLIEVRALTKGREDKHDRDRPR